MKPAWKKPFIFVLSAVGIMGLTLCYLWWQTQSYGLSAIQQTLAFLSVMIFAVVGVRTLIRWADFWTAQEKQTEVKRGKWSWRLFLTLMLWDAALLLIAWPLRSVLTEPMTLKQSMERWVCGDGIHYLDIARDWYLSTGSVDRVVQLVFLPGYPMIIRLFHLFIPNWTYAALAASGVCFAAGGTAMYRLLQLDLEETAAKRAIVILCLFPGSFFFAAAMSESLFLLCCVECLYLARTGRWVPAGVIGAAAAFTRSLGITLLVPLIVELVGSPQKKKFITWISLIFIPAGFGAYLLINRHVSGNAFQFLIYQSEHWNQKLGFFFHTASYQADYAAAALRNDPHTFWGLWLPNLAAAFCALGVMVYGAGKLRASECVWFLPYYSIAIGATWLLSAPRYLLVFFPLSAALAMAAEKRWKKLILYPILLIVSCMYFYVFLMRWQVY